MKKIAYISGLACILAMGSAFAKSGESTISVGYAQGDLQGIVNKANGLNLKYRYEQDNGQSLGVISSFTYIEKHRDESSDYNKDQYYGFTAGPAWRISDWASLYGVIGLGYGKSISNAHDGSRHRGGSDVGITYGAGLQFNPMENIAFDVSYEQSRIRSTDVGTWIAGVGYHF